LHFGAGPNQLPEPWQNLSATHDIRKPLRFNSGAARAIMAEHVIEHVSFHSGIAFMAEALRVLEPGGVLRLGFPDVSRFLKRKLDGFTLNGTKALRYAELMNDSKGTTVDERGGLFAMLTSWGHQSAWTRGNAAATLLVVGFAQVAEREYGLGELAGIDGHHRDVGYEMATIETTVLEAKKA
jgi:hypothetical protein